MAEDIKDLIEKIQQEGIQAAEEKAKQIEDEARQRAEAILSRARFDADQMISAASERIRGEEEREKALLDQAGRDLLLFLREEINAMLHRIVVSDIHQVISPEDLSLLLSDLIRDYKKGEGSDIIVALNEKDLELMENNYLHKISRRQPSAQPCRSARRQHMARTRRIIARRFRTVRSHKYRPRMLHHIQQPHLRNTQMLRRKLIRQLHRVL